MRGLIAALAGAGRWIAAERRLIIYNLSVAAGVAMVGVGIGLHDVGIGLATAGVLIIALAVFALRVYIGRRD